MTIKSQDLRFAQMVWDGEYQLFLGWAIKWTAILATQLVLLSIQQILSSKIKLVGAPEKVMLGRPKYIERTDQDSLIHSHSRYPSHIDEMVLVGTHKLSGKCLRPDRPMYFYSRVVFAFDFPPLVFAFMILQGACDDSPPLVFVYFRFRKL